MGVKFLCLIMAGIHSGILDKEGFPLRSSHTSACDESGWLASIWHFMKAFRADLVFCRWFNLVQSLGQLNTCLSNWPNSVLMSS